MKAKPQKGLRAVGGASPQPWEALAADATDRSTELIRALSAAHPVHAAAAAMSWHANQAITRLVGTTFAAALHTRRSAEALAAAGERNLPAGPLRSAVTRAANWQIAAANATADFATAFGRRYGHLAFAFPRPGAL
jgi:hypothetical protein